MKSIRLGLLLALFAFEGCAALHHAQPLAAGHIIHNDPVAGDWRGSWHSLAEGGGHHARVSIEPNPNQPTYTLHLQLSRVEEWIGGFDVPGVTLQLAPDGSYRFDVKVPVAESDSGHVAEAMQLKGELKGNTLVINYETNDALKPLDQGEIDLRRVPASERS